MCFSTRHRRDTVDESFDTLESHARTPQGLKLVPHLADAREGARPPKRF